MNQIVLKTKRLILRKYATEDIDNLHAILSDPVTMQFWPAPFTREGSEQWLHNNLKRYRAQGYGRWAMVHQESGRIIGDCGIVLSELDNQMEHDLGYILDKEYWGLGLATEAAKACKEYGTSELNLHRLCANMAFDHIGSQRVAEKIGMTRVKEYRNKRNRDILTYLYVWEASSQS
ncbi:GNAT family N-acetyltransferase [Brevibacillus sp. NRS-1366]|uniref:GNAT family N-acetyltransferase n=1 Tax=Brevibacillus sp. NRS-1366 TaxID=3233899 RepID=UPI003D1FFA15